VCVPSTIRMDTRARAMSKNLVNRENIAYRVLCTEKHRYHCANLLHWPTVVAQKLNELR
jgi:hypothetical protein